MRARGGGLIPADDPRAGRSRRAGAAPATRAATASDAPRAEDRVAALGRPPGWRAASPPLTAAACGNSVARPGPRRSEWRRMSSAFQRDTAVTPDPGVPRPLPRPSARDVGGAHRPVGRDLARDGDPCHERRRCRTPMPLRSVSCVFAAPVECGDAEIDVTVLRAGPHRRPGLRPRCARRAATAGLTAIAVFGAFTPRVTSSPTSTRRSSRRSTPLPSFRDPLPDGVEFDARPFPLWVHHLEGKPVVGAPAVGGVRRHHERARDVPALRRAAAPARRHRRSARARRGVGHDAGRGRRAARCADRARLVRTERRPHGPHHRARPGPSGCSPATGPGAPATATRRSRWSSGTR